MDFKYIIGCVMFTVIGQLLIKYGVTEVKNGSSLLSYVFNIYIFLGLFSAVIAAISWIKALQIYDLSYAYPFMSLSFLLVAIFSVIFFHESMNLKQWLGLLIVMLGLYIGSR